MQNAGDRVRMNKQHWDAMAVRTQQKKPRLIEQIRNGAPYLEQMEPKLAPYLSDIDEKKVIILQFGDALVLLACAKKGASVMGVDLSSEQVRLARESAAYCGVEVQLVQGDCQNLPESIPELYFDLAVAEDGIFIWIENLDAWMRNTYRVLKSGGILIVSDFHPLSHCTKEENGIVTFRRSYLNQQPGIYQPEPNIPPAMEFYWKISDIINAAIEVGFRIDHLDEWYVGPDSEEFRLTPNYFLLLARKDQVGDFG